MEYYNLKLINKNVTYNGIDRIMIYYEIMNKNHIEFFRNSNKYLERTIFPKKNSISFHKKNITICTTCMNRFHDISRTIIKNIEDNDDYENLEFLLLDYSSSDGLKNWILESEHIRNYIDKGRLVVYRTENQKFFRPNHSRNMSFRLATGELIANVDSDNFTHKGYASRINECASVGDNSLLIVPDNFLVRDSNRILLKGRFAVYKNDLEMLHGFDEDLDEGFGHDDLNFVFRAMLAGFKIVRYEGLFTEDRLETKDKERVKFVKNKNFSEIQKNNSSITYEKISKGKITVNSNGWGSGVVWKNFEEKVELY